jgi:hypothetical protein
MASTNNAEKPKLAIAYAYILTIGSFVGLLFFLGVYLTGLNFGWLKHEVSPVVLAITIFIASCYGLVTGSGLLTRKKYGWMLTQFLFIYLIVKAIYSLFLFTYINYQNITPFKFWGFTILKSAFIISLIGFFLVYFNQKRALNYYRMESEEAHRIYLISFLTSMIIIFLNFFIRK